MLYTVGMDLDDTGEYTCVCTTQSYVSVHTFHHMNVASLFDSILVPSFYHRNTYKHWELLELSLGMQDTSILHLKNNEKVNIFGALKVNFTSVFNV